MITLYLVRHGETEENAAQILQGQMPGHLSPVGVQQAKALCYTLKNIHFDVLVSSDLKRCTDTAEILNEERLLQLCITPLLRERDWGSFTGRKIPSIQNTPFPADIESVEAMLDRARTFVDYLKTNFDGKSVLAVGHGLIDRAVQSIVLNKPMKDIARMGNAEFRVLEI